MDQVDVWDDLVGDAWVTHAHLIDAHDGALGAGAIDRLEPLAGKRVLDVGCGVGLTARRLAERVGPSGRVVGIDLATKMIEHGRSSYPELEQLQLVCGDVLSTDFGAPFDVIHSRNGLMFFDDAPAAFRRLRELVADGGALAFSCWNAPATNPWMTAPVTAVNTIVPPPAPPPPGGPGPFAFADHAVVARLLEGAGWAQIEAEAVTLAEPHPAGGAEAFAAVMLAIVPPLAAAARRAPERRQELLAAIAESVAGYEEGGVLRAPASAWVVSAIAA